MSAGCSQVISSFIKVSIIPVQTCNAPPVLHQIENTVAAVAGDTSIALALDTGFTPVGGAYTAASKFPLVPGTRIYLGTEIVEIADPTNGSGVYFITTTPIPVNVVRLKGAIANNTTSQTYFAIPLCLKSANVTTASTQVDNTTNCTGALFTQLTVGYMKTLELAGFLASGDYGFFTLEQIGTALKSAYYAIDYDGRFLSAGVVQLTEPSITESVVKQLAGYTIQGQIQNVSEKYPAFLTVAEQTALATTRSRYGFRPAQDIVTI